jgi:hypothetical protein
MKFQAESWSTRSVVLFNDATEGAIVVLVVTINVSEFVGKSCSE